MPLPIPAVAVSFAARFFITAVLNWAFGKVTDRFERQQEAQVNFIKGMEAAQHERDLWTEIYKQAKYETPGDFDGLLDRIGVSGTDRNRGAAVTAERYREPRIFE